MNLVVPLDEPYRPLAAGLGVVALWSMALVLGTSWLPDICRITSGARSTISAL